ncbi:hypothetical protein V1638_03440 [Pseudarthrobacter sp. J64]|uniref:sunset domain-containing protein n=1 Tax=Pseudarthrobacter sp. J64 TaxID=3116485 RepID=UPI002E7FC20E|nr:hypothetical protein [Pseudarthrobacter sp. J64]MEE2568452.1 hypothetical protein [Pseudarthrobacter sp. J64]
MDFVIWIIVIVLVVALVWWMVNRRGPAQDSPSASPTDASEDRQGAGRTHSEGALSQGLAGPSAEAAGTAGLPGAGGFGTPAAATPPATPDDEHDAAVAYGVAADKPTAEAGNSTAAASAPDSTADVERSAGAESRSAETQSAEPQGGTEGGDVDDWAAGAATERDPSEVSSLEMPEQETAPGAPAAAQEPQADSIDDDQSEWEAQWSDAQGTPTPPPSHHDEYTAPHAPTLPGAETAAAEAADEQPDEAAPAGHLAAEQPYGEGSASPGPDGSGPEGYTVKGDASAMVYYDEGDPGYEDAPSSVWFISPAHAEAAGFREPRRIRR